MNKQLNARLHLLLTQTHNTVFKKALVFGFTSGRSDSSRDMTDQEAREMIQYLEGQNTAPDPADRMRKKIISMAREMGWEIRTAKGRAADMERIKNWVLKYGLHKKPFKDYQVNELPALVTQFERVYKDYLSAV